MKVQDLMRIKSRPVQTIASSRSVDDAVNLMTDKKAGALIVTENDRPVGIFAERDVFRYYLRDKTTALSEITLRHAMTDKLIVARPEDEISDVLVMMARAEIRHLPVIEEKNIIGILTLGDLIENQIESLIGEIQQLRDYIEDLHEAARD
jgi:CBS domain-containing protein